MARILIFESNGKPLGEVDEWINAPHYVGLVIRVVLPNQIGWYICLKHGQYTPINLADVPGEVLASCYLRDLEV